MGKTMRRAAVAAVLVLAVATVSVHCLDDATRKMMETVDPTPLIMNKKMVQSFMDCFFDRGPCNVIAAQIKKNIGEVLESACTTCSPEQRALIATVLASFVPRYPDEWAEFLRKYDPEGKYWPELKSNLGLEQLLQ